MADHYLLQSQKNDVFAAIQAAGLNPLDFEWETVFSEYAAHGDAGMRVPLLMHKPSQATCIFDWQANRSPHRPVVIYTPAYETPQEVRHVGGWAEQLGCVEQWLGYLTREWQTPSLWAELERSRHLFTAVGDRDADNSPFSAQEVTEIAAKLDEVRLYVRRTHQLSEEQYVVLERRLDYLAEAATRVGRIDWRNLLIGSLLGAVVQAVLPPEPVQDAINLALRGLSHLFGIHIPELPR